VSGEFHALKASHPVKAPRNTCLGMRVSLSDDVDFVKPEKCLSLSQAGNEFLFPVRPSRSLVTVLTKLSRLPYFSYSSSYYIDSH
jgi:hypothetical protein